MDEKMKKIITLALSFVAVFTVAVFADTALIQVDPATGRPIVVPIPNAEPPVVSTEPTPVKIVPSVPPPPVPAAPTDTGTLPPVWPVSYVYFTLPGGINLVTPWSAAIAAEGYDFIGHESITQGYVPLAQFWKITALLGAGINGRGEASPMGGGMVDLAHVPVSPMADFHLALTGGYNVNAKHALAVLSGSVQFLK